MNGTYYKEEGTSNTPFYVFLYIIILIVLSPNNDKNLTLIYDLLTNV